MTNKLNELTKGKYKDYAEKSRKDTSERMKKDYNTDKKSNKDEKKLESRYGYGTKAEKKSCMSEAVENLIHSVVDQKPLDTKAAFDAMMKEKLADMLDVYKSHIAADFGREPDEEEVEEEKPQAETDESELTDDQIEELLGGLSDEELETLLKDMEAEDELKSGNGNGHEEDAEEADDNPTQDDDDKNKEQTNDELDEGGISDRINATIAGVKAYRATRAAQKDKYYKSLPSSGTVTSLSSGPVKSRGFKEGFDFKKFKKNHENDKSDDDDGDEGGDKKKFDFKKKGKGGDDDDGDDKGGDKKGGGKKPTATCSCDEETVTEGKKKIDKAAYARFWAHDPKQGEEIRKFGAKSRSEAKGFKSGAAEIKRLKKKGQ